MQRITANVYAETRFRGCNPGFVVTSVGIVMIDTPYRPSDAIAWREEVMKKGEVRYLINTEPHGDHYTGNYFFPGTVIAQDGVREALKAVSVNQILERVAELDPQGMSLMAGYQLRPPTITFSKKLTLYLGSHTFELIHLPGHTAAEIGVYIPEERVIFTGDNVFHRVQAFLHESHPVEWLASLERIGELDIVCIVPGHGEVCDKSYLPEMAAFIREWIEVVRKAVEQGMTKQQAMESISFLDRYPMDIGLESRAKDVQRMNVDRLYELIKERGLQIP
jgi:cyclase